VQLIAARPARVFGQATAAGAVFSVTQTRQGVTTLELLNKRPRCGAPDPTLSVQAHGSFQTRGLPVERRCQILIRGAYRIGS